MVLVWRCQGQHTAPFSWPSVNVGINTWPSQVKGEVGVGEEHRLRPPESGSNHCFLTGRPGTSTSPPFACCGSVNREWQHSRFHRVVTRSKWCDGPRRALTHCWGYLCLLPGNVSEQQAAPQATSLGVSSSPSDPTG